MGELLGASFGSIADACGSSALRFCWPAISPVLQTSGRALGDDDAVDIACICDWMQMMVLNSFGRSVDPLSLDDYLCGGTSVSVGASILVGMDDVLL
ncbi:hypothetical protein Dimus_029576 [Dionaea muscipula]